MAPCSEAGEPAAASTSHLSVVVAASSKRVSSTSEADAEETVGTRRLDSHRVPGEAVVSVERGADQSLLRSILESLRK